ncbi:NUDIX hydrolase [Hoyosella sp. YIM 151337]|uniref:NUDIX hydrolase n=1 Tax=Hoyosella sp. YIM 151337 TaxID=2992742 RepID=UPI002236C14F|nr:NUDIX hydrolase [Hoyosella sp. YIM 151337]MCW4352319.1 NUDIX hydrolase [Hoyosella sp. YIM 151337]
MTALHASAVAALTNFHAPTSEQDSVRHTMLAFLDAAPDGCLRKHAPGHVTASSLVLSEDRSRVLLTLHPKVGRWIQLGGHCEESDATIHDAALREATEESGISGLRLDPHVLGLHTHPITCSLGVPTRHLDVRFLIWAPDRAPAIRSAESLDLRWWPISDLPSNAEHDTIAQLLRFSERHAAPG